MNILITGASGLLGSALSPFLRELGHQVVPLHRGPSAQGKAVWDPLRGEIYLRGPIDAAVHLAGESIAARWTPARKQAIRSSRVQGTQLLSQTLAQLEPMPKLLVCASAIGYYGDCGNDWLDEQSAAGDGFLAEIVRDWEAAAQPAARRGIRVVNLRLGIVLSADGGALAKMLPVFRLGLGGRVGNGQQYWSWIALDDVLGVIRHLLLHEPLRGPVNVVSPHPVTNAQFTRALARVVRRPGFLAVPAFAARLALGEMADETLLASARVRPVCLQETGYEFRFPELEPALRHVLRPTPAN